MIASQVNFSSSTITNIFGEKFHNNTDKVS